MNDYLLFIDSEASGLPKNLDLPYSTPGNWPYIIQISWLIYDRTGIKIKEEDHYIKENDITLNPKSTRIHRLRKDFLELNGRPRVEVLHRLAEDLANYEPLIVGHFLNLDLKLIGAECYRASIPDVTKGLPHFCTMLDPTQPFRHLRLAVLYAGLFHRPQPNPHDALSDAAATAECYFELRKLGQIHPV